MLLTFLLWLLSDDGVPMYAMVYHIATYVLLFELNYPIEST